MIIDENNLQFGNEKCWKSVRSPHVTLRDTSKLLRFMNSPQTYDNRLQCR